MRQTQTNQKPTPFILPLPNPLYFYKRSSVKNQQDWEKRSERMKEFCRGSLCWMLEKISRVSWEIIRGKGTSLSGGECSVSKNWSRHVDNFFLSRSRSKFRIDDGDTFGETQPPLLPLIMQFNWVWPEEWTVQNPKAQAGRNKCWRKAGVLQC